MSSRLNEKILVKIVAFLDPVL